ncbi:uncharacterized protein LOC117815890 isoform X1 [Xyrichtys novacula]|uniref:Uncharacterized protein LOC117815890 isoform X1 n=1 Tax=Xyrichtys novacula TaxID=13765 RepID=A0AAV1EX50_XYRNO|nr:uncharacterized protein LOC117815890 isoform X1 [Xyrichtys novacula]
MDPLLWDAIQSLRSGRNLQSGLNSSKNETSETNDNQNSSCEFSRYTVDRPQSSAEVSERWEGPSSTSYDFSDKESEAEDPDGEPLVVEELDPELARKCKELREIEERIKQKKVFIALKKVVKTSTLASTTNGELDGCGSPTLKDRVNAILQQRHSFVALLKNHSPQERLKSSSLSKQQDDHPLKLRVKALLRQKMDDPFVFSAYREIPEITPPPPAQRETVQEANNIDLGFQRFLSVLNKGVDINILSKIVNSDGEDPHVSDKVPDIQHPASKGKVDPPFRSVSQGVDTPARSKSQRSNSGASLSCHSHTSSVERKTSPHSRERSLSERFSLPDDMKERKDRGDRCMASSGVCQSGHIVTSSAEKRIKPLSRERSLTERFSLSNDEQKKKADSCFASSSRSKSPPAVKRKKKREEIPKLDKHQEQLQNILKTLGLSLGAEEMSNLADRTQERLYGKRRAKSPEEQETQQSSSSRHYRNSSSSSSSSSSGSTSRSSSPSPHQSSDSVGYKQRRRSRDRSRKRLRNHKSKEDSPKGKRHRDRDKEGEHSKESLTHENPPSHQPFPTYPLQDPGGTPGLMGSNYSWYPGYGDYHHSNSYEAATNSYWMYHRDAHPPPFYQSVHPYRQEPFRYFPEPQNIYLDANPDLSKSEGQVGPTSRTRCLHVVPTQTTSEKKKKAIDEKFRLWLKEKQMEWSAMREATEGKTQTEEEKKEALHGDEDDSTSEQSEEEKQTPTEEEIKINLRKMNDLIT